MADQELLSLALIVMLIALSGFFSSAEAAFLSVEKLRLAHLVSIGEPGAHRVAEMLSQPARLLSTILLGNNLVNVAFTALITVLAIDVLGQGRGVLAATLLGTTVLLILGEIVPKTLAVTYAQRVAFIYARPIKAIEVVFWPVIALLQWITRVFSSRFDLAPGGGASITEAELRTLLNIGEAEGTFTPYEVGMLRNVISFGRRQVREVMTPRPEIVSIPADASIEDFLSAYLACGHTRLPIRGDSEDIVGLVSGKDILSAVASGSDLSSSASLLMREASFVPETKPLATLFDEMRATGKQMVIVLDEHAATAGLVTLKQLAEEVVGSVGEEGSAPEEEYHSVEANVFRVEGGMNIREANESMELGLPDGPYDTVAGFVLEILGHIPREGEYFNHGALRVEVERMNRHKIETIRLAKPDSEAI